MRGISSFLRRRRFAKAIADRDASALESVLAVLPTEEVLVVDAALLAIAVNARNSQLLRTLLERGVTRGMPDAFAAAVASADVSMVEAFVEFGAMNYWWQMHPGPRGAVPIRKIYERPDVKVRLGAVIEPAKERMIRAAPQDVQKLWVNGPEDNAGRTLFAWLKEHQGEKITVSHSWDVGRYLRPSGDESMTWSREGYSTDVNKTEWIVGTLDIGAKTSPWAAAETTLHWAFGNLPAELELPLATYQEAEVLTSRLVYWRGTDLQSGEWKPYGEIPTWPVAAKSKGAVRERTFLTFEAS